MSIGGKLFYNLIESIFDEFFGEGNCGLITLVWLLSGGISAISEGFELEFQVKFMLRINF